MASSLSFSLLPFFSKLSQNVAISSALVEPTMVLLQKTSNASFSALWKRESCFPPKQSFTYWMYLSCRRITRRTNMLSWLDASFFGSRLPSTACSAALTREMPSASTCFLKMAATGSFPLSIRLNSRYMRERSSTLSSRRRAAHPDCSFPSSWDWYAASTSPSTSRSTFASLEACKYPSPASSKPRTLRRSLSRHSSALIMYSGQLSDWIHSAPFRR
mmetsp:Transcript_3739/g.10266  ORF Transcript_3739/g.10266 Transcript_3739/m.10266 type:complete len:217 (-) Transcript_3739:638-1288(-)